MRPSFLNPLFASAQTISGIGPRFILLLKKCLALPGVTEPRVIDLLWHMPTGVIDRRAEPQLASAVPGSIVTLQLRVLKHKPAPRGNRKAPHKVTCEDDTGRIDLVFFHAERKFIEKQLPEGEIRFVSGRIERYGEALQMAHPDYIVAPEARDDLPMLEPVYPLTAGLSGKIMVKAARQAVDRVPDVPEWQDSRWLEARGWPAFKTAINRIHRPLDAPDVSNGAGPWQRLAYDELLAGQLAFALVRQNMKAERGRRLTGKGDIRQKIADALPFKLTGSQQTALAEISDDLAASHRMLRLLQGDVGSGKTVVALMTMAVAIEAGAQAALMAPTEVLARQHQETIAPLAEAAGLRIALLTGREKGKVRDAILERLASGETDILIGTHALFQSDVVFKDLALAVIDEQHRFGVHQRLALQAKGANNDTNVLVMTATPIPRTLLMTHYGDLDVSKLTEKPAGRKPITTKALPLESLERLVERIRAQLAEGAQVYWVCPLIESSELTDLAAAEERFAHLRQIFGEGVGLLHGALSAKEKDETMAAFAEGAIKILVATTVIEVGVNVPNANIMVIEHAERFGLAQLHQLRGRVGRGSRESFCMLVYKAPLGETAGQRLKMMEETEDGFKIAEKDLELRGGGEILGARQSGAPGFRVAEVPGYDTLLAAASDDAALILGSDPNLTSPRGQALRTLLYVFECDEAVRLFRAA
ncbi:DNA helicase, ATP-dependent resolution of Holliday junctions, branch migration [Hyphomicrobium sp. GJ21]|uniref:ATP-dependent DNA helicase RecG n=1 Tax=Hyphomicrobium sp. GJ21 TaxID=113574 RepID=UPI000622B9DB|nr:ATP-dependent DNA helicase RecG [Hyphomicrobium sp. GJ21]CEJ85074.1 DNA helicase, ATP-dependent resolution of Holliday junctions, branch migration [Hyphomicrobium sp. GJ21]